MGIFAAGGPFPGFPVKISKNGPRIRIPGPKLPIWASFYADWAIFLEKLIFAVGGPGRANLVH